MVAMAQPKIESMLGPNVITIKEASKRTGYNAEYLRRLIRQDKIEADKLGATYLVKLDSLIHYAEMMRTVGDNRSGPR